MTSDPEPFFPTPGKLLLVDDEPSILAALRRLLRSDGYHISAETDPKTALARLQEEEYDLIISDQRMPEMTGVDFLRHAKEVRPHSMRIVLSGYTDLNSVTSAINEGAIYKFLTKPWDPVQLRYHIAEAVRHKNLADDNRRMSIQLHHVNTQLKEANNQLAALVSRQQDSLFRDETILQTLQELLRQIPVPLLACDEQRMIVFCNEAAQELLGTEGKPIQPLGLDLLAAWPDAPEAPPPWKEAGLVVRGRRVGVECRPVELRGQTRGKLYVFLPEFRT